MNPVTVIKEFTAASSNVFSGTELESPNFSGRILLWMASTVNTATLAVPTQGRSGQTPVAQTVPKKTDGIPMMQDQPAYTIPVEAGVKPTAVLAGTTGTVTMYAIGVSP